MQLLVYLFTGATAVIASSGAVWSAMTTRNLVDRDVSILLVVWAMLLWALFSFASYDVVVFSGGEMFHETYRAWSILGAVFGGSLTIFLYHLVFGALRPELDDSGVMG